MRIELPSNNSNPIPPLESHYARELITAGNQYGQAVYRHSILPLRIFEAARIATAVINGCTICKNWRTARDAAYLNIEGGIRTRGPEPDEDFYQHLLNEQYDQLSLKEKLAVEYAKGMGLNPQELAKNEDFWQRFKAEYTDEEIVDLTYAIAAWMGLGRVAHVLGVDTACTLP